MSFAGNRNARRLGLRRIRAALVAVAVAATCLVAWAAPAQALPLSVTVTIVRVAECCPGGPIDVTSEADFYGRTTIAGTSTWRASRMCSRVCGIGPSGALTTRIAPSIWAAPVIMFLM